MDYYFTAAVKMYSHLYPVRAHSRSIVDLALDYYFTAAVKMYSYLYPVWAHSRSMLDAEYRKCAVFIRFQSYTLGNDAKYNNILN